MIRFIEQTNLEIGLMNYLFDMVLICVSFNYPVVVALLSVFFFV